MEKKHKQCQQDVINRTKKTHNCFKEMPINRNGNYHYLDVTGYPHADKSHLKPFAVECEDGSSKLQRESNKLDLIEWKKHYPEGEIFQVESANEIDLNKLKKNNNQKVFVRRYP